MNSSLFLNDKSGQSQDRSLAVSGVVVSALKYAWTKIHHFDSVLNHMPFINRSLKSVCLLGSVIFCSLSAIAQPSLVRMGAQTEILPRAKANRVNAALSLSPLNSFVVWNDNGIDKSAEGIGVAQLNVNTLKASSVTQVNKSATGDQSLPKIQRLSNGQMVIVWQGSPAGMPDIYGRLMKTNLVFTSAVDVLVNSYSLDQQVKPVVTSLLDGSALIAWGSWKQDNDMLGVFARKMTATGTFGAKEFQVNEATSYNQRNPAVATLKSGNFVVVWISERETSFSSVDVYARIYTPACVPLTHEFRINRSKDICGDPSIAALPDGGFTVVWSQNDSVSSANGWDIVGASFGPTGQLRTPPFKINTHLPDNQYEPKIAAGPVGCMVVWTSKGQDNLTDGSEGVYGRFLLNGSQPVGDELQVNTTTINQQILPAVAWNGVDRFVVVWTSPIIDYGVSLFGQAFILE